MKSNLVKKLKSDMQAKEVITKLSKKDEQVQLPKHTFEIIPSTHFIKLNEFQRKLLLKALDLYFPDLHVRIVYTKEYDIMSEEGLERFLSILDGEMSDPNHYEIYKDYKAEEYDFLRQLRLKYMTKVRK